MRQIPLKMVLILGIFLVLTVSVSGCTSNTGSSSSSNGPGVNSMNLSSYFDSAYGGATGILATPFYKTTAPDGNDMYVGVVRNFSQQSAANTITIEIASSQSEAKQIYNSAVSAATSAGYVARSTAPSLSFHATQGAGWQGDLGFKYKAVEYYPWSDTVSSSGGTISPGGSGVYETAWFVETQYM